MADAAEEDLSGFRSWSGFQRLLPLHHPLFEDWDVELQSIIADTPQVGERVHQLMLGKAGVHFPWMHFIQKYIQGPHCNYLL